jgi:hypothetical protein
MNRKRTRMMACWPLVGLKASRGTVIMCLAGAILLTLALIAPLPTAAQGDATTPTDTPSPTPTPTDTPSPTPTPTDTPSPTPMPTLEPPSPTVTPEPSATLAPPTPAPSPTATPWPSPSPTAIPQVEVIGRAVIPGRDTPLPVTIQALAANAPVAQVVSGPDGSYQLTLPATSAPYVFLYSAPLCLPTRVDVLIPQSSAPVNLPEVSLILGDIDGNQSIGLEDAALVGMSIENASQPYNADLNGDGQTNVLDLVLVARSFGGAANQ